MWLGLGRDSSRRSSYPETHRAAEAEIRANSPSCPDCSRIKLPQFLTQCLRNMSKTVRIGVDSRWVGGSCERALRGQLSFYPGEAVSGCASGGDDWWCEFGWFFKTSIWSRIWNASSKCKHLNLISILPGSWRGSGSGCVRRQAGGVCRSCCCREKVEQRGREHHWAGALWATN